MTRTTWWTRVATGCLAVGLATGHASAASAAVDVQLVEAVSPSTDSDKSVRALCPRGTKLYSAGGAVDNRSGDVVIDSIRPSADLSGVVVRARSRTTTSAWAVTAYALCAAGNPELARDEPFGTASVDLKEASDHCAVAGSLTGVGGDVVGNDAEDKAALYGLVPDEGLTTATAMGSGPANAQWTMEASAICDATMAGSLVRVVADSGEFPDLGAQEATATCDDGFQLMGGGGLVTGETPDSEAVLVSAKPDPGTDSMTVIAPDGASRWNVEAYAICLKKG
ncbi:hypothetical protein [Saccharothrix luteola]|uniref:hypothetical protein n=1 Tax=Saccharothrix luteola TaxID=2893018 RepID=UPI001E411F20|nr:hypothetical protein [Saccharothrix luteola]MCC8243107.1 hypothetical protein [Saccharothrix luteola]